MSTLQQLREDFSRSWDNLMEGWRHLSERASGALTRFNPVRRSDEQDRSPAAVQNTRWGLMAAEVFDDDEKVVVKLEVPGMEPDDFDIEINSDVLVVRGEKKFQREKKKGNYHLMECAYGRFERAIPLPSEVDDTKTEASYKHGLLKISLPKTGQKKRRRISVIQS